MLLIPTRLAPSSIHGFGVFAVARIANGAPVWRFAKGLDLEFSPDIVPTLPVHVQKFFAHYGYLDRHVQRIILCFDDARFVNHSETANIGTDYRQDSYGLDVALRDIAAGEEITMNYE